MNHVNEYYNIQLNISNTNIKIKHTWIDIKLSYKELNISKDDTYYQFIYLLYLSLDTEMNSRIPQIYQYLLDFNIKDESVLFEKLKEHKNWEYVNMLNNFDYDNFIEKNINSIGLEGLIKITNDLITKFKNKGLNKRTKLLNFVDEPVLDINSLTSFYKNFSEYFKTKTSKHISKFKYIIKEVIEELNGNRPFNEAQRN